MHYIERKYQNDGFATWVKILRALAVTNNHFLNLNNDIELMFLASKCHISEERLKEILSDLATLGEIDKELWEKYRVVWNQKFIDSIQDAYKKRNNKCITIHDLFLLLDGLGLRKLGKEDRKGTGNPKRIEKNRKLNKIKEEDIPSEEEFVKYFLDNGFPKELGERAYKGYKENGWKDSNDKPVKNWKMKCQQVWFSDKNKKVTGNDKFNPSEY